MQRPAALAFVLTGLALAGCGSRAPQGAQGPLNETQAAAAGVAPDADVVMRERWQRMFTDPARVVAAANEFGYAVGGYSGTGTAYAAKGKVQTLPRTPGAITVRTDFEANGRSAGAIDTVRFRFDIDEARAPESQKEADARRIPQRILNGFLSRFEVGTGDDIKRAINERRSASVLLHGVAIRVDVQPLQGSTAANSNTLLVSFTRSEAPASPQNANSTARK